ncbi:MAG: hypothetical protein HY909_20135 [Deltaproteobacteria bacterium]|nr:hypothetical protein [Deltaproteobacteria bacterium]
MLNTELVTKDHGPALRRALRGLDGVLGVYTVECACALGPHPHYLVVTAGDFESTMAVASTLDALEFTGLDYDLVPARDSLPPNALALSLRPRRMCG